MTVSKKFITAAVGLAVVVIVIAYARIKAHEATTNTEVVPNVSADNLAPLVNMDATANWRTYTNKRYAYTLRYPSYWYVDNTLGETDFSQRGPQEDNTFMGGDVIISNYSKPSSYTAANVPADIFDVNLVIWKVDPTVTYGQFITQNHFVNGTEENATINGLSAVRLSSTGEGETRVNTFIKIDGNMVVFTYSAKTDDLSDANIAEQIVQSFERNP